MARSSGHRQTMEDMRRMASKYPNPSLVRPGVDLTDLWRSMRAAIGGPARSLPGMCCSMTTDTLHVVCTCTAAAVVTLALKSFSQRLRACADWRHYFRALRMASVPYGRILQTFASADHGCVYRASVRKATLLACAPSRPFPCVSDWALTGTFSCRCCGTPLW